MIKQRKFKKNAKLEVIWRDTVADPKWVDSKDDMEKEPNDMITSLGYFYKWDKKRIYISPMVGAGSRDKTTIPIGCIESIKVLK